MKIAPVSLSILRADFATMADVGYVLGAKAPSLDCDITKIKNIDCSGYVRLALYRATKGQMVLTDGSQNQREQMEQSGAHQVAKYSDIGQYCTESRLFVCFIKPFTNGCGSTGHIWLVHRPAMAKPPRTLESHYHTGINSRLWNYATLKKQFYSGFELPTTE